jgi:hypothetical protein
MLDFALVFAVPPPVRASIPFMSPPVLACPTLRTKDLEMKSVFECLAVIRKLIEA